MGTLKHVAVDHFDARTDTKGMSTIIFNGAFLVVGSRIQRINSEDKLSEAFTLKGRFAVLPRGNAKARVFAGMIDVQGYMT